MSPGEKLRYIRDRWDGGPTQPEFASTLGVTEYQYKNYESNRTPLPKFIAKKLADKLGFDLNWFYDGTENEPRPVSYPTLIDRSPVKTVGSAQLPLYPEVPAGNWQTPPEEALDMVEVPIAIGGKDRFACTVIGDSLSPGIKHGDIAIFHKHKDPRAGLVWLAENQDKETTCKVLRWFDGAHRLEPLNPNYPGVETHNFTLIGYLIGLIRDLGGGAQIVITNPTGIKPEHLP